MRLVEVAVVTHPKLLASLVLGSVVFGCGPDPEAQCSSLEEASCPEGQLNGEDTLYCVDYYDGDCSSEWDTYVECAKQSPICVDAQTGQQEAHPCEVERFEHGNCVCHVEAEYGWSPWCDLYGD